MTEHIARLQRYLDRPANSKLYSPEHIHGFDADGPNEAVLRASDIQTVISRVIELESQLESIDAGGVERLRSDPWHQAVLNACMSTEACYEAGDPEKTLRQLLDWHVMNERHHAQSAQAVAEPNPSVPIDILNLIDDYGCSRADKDGKSAIHIGRLVAALRTWAGSLTRSTLPTPKAEPPDWWRKRADEIELQVAQTGSTEAMRCFTDMRTLLQSAAKAEPAPAVPSEDDCIDTYHALTGMHLWTEEGHAEVVRKMRAFAARWPGSPSEAQANPKHSPLPAAQPAVEPVAYLHDDGYWTAAKTEQGRALSDRLHFAGSPKIGVHLHPAPAPNALDAETPFLQETDQHLLHRFIETSEDDESYDISKDDVKRLANLGVLESCGFGRYGVTMFGYWAHEHFWHQNPSLPLKTNSDRDHEKRAAIAAQSAQKGGAL